MTAVDAADSADGKSEDTRKIDEREEQRERLRDALEVKPTLDGVVWMRSGKGGEYMVFTRLIFMHKESQLWYVKEPRSFVLRRMTVSRPHRFFAVLLAASPPCRYT